MNEEVDIDYGGLISLRAFGLLAIFLGPLGIHDFAIGRKKEGFSHLALLATAIFFLVFMIDSFLPPTLVFSGWAWAIWELISYRNNFKENHLPGEVGLIKSFMVTARVSITTVMLTILANALFVQGLIGSKRCIGSACAGAGWGLVFVVALGLYPALLAIIFTIFNTFCKHNFKIYH